MIPDLQAAVLCDDVRQEKNGKFILIGIFDGLSLPALPFVLPRICLFSRWCCGQGRFTYQSRILAPDGQHVLAQGRGVPLTLDDDRRVATSVEFFVRLRFAEAGVHWIEIHLDRQLKLRFPLHVRRVAQAARPADAGESPP